MFLTIEDCGMACKRLREYSATWNGMWDTQNSFLNEQRQCGENELWRTQEEENESEENSGIIIDAMITSYAPLILVFMFLVIEDHGMACKRLREYSATWNGMWDTWHSFLNEQWQCGGNELWRTQEEENESEGEKVALSSVP